MWVRGSEFQQDCGSETINIYYLQLGKLADAEISSH